MKSVVSLLFALASLGLASLAPETYVIPSGLQEGVATADTVVGEKAFDGPHVSVNNGTAYQWWYFDAVSADANALLAAQFYPGWFPTENAILLNVVWPNGTVYYNTIPAGALQLSTVGDGSQGYVDDGAFTWFGASDLSAYHLTLNLPEIGLSGTMTMQSLAPAHVAAGLDVPGASFEFAPDLNWGNAVPDSAATVNLTINGTDLSFAGTGYHDQNWGLAAFTEDLTQWYWGHAHVGNYSLVFFYHIGQSSTVTASAYLAVNGRPIIAETSVITVTPVGDGLTVPVPPTSNVTSWDIAIHDPFFGKHAFTVVNNYEAQNNLVYSRWIGTATGGPVGKTNSTGSGIVEMMTNPSLE